jgi:hypothetical protein
MARQNQRSITPKCEKYDYMTTFVIIKDIYDYHDYSAIRLIAKVISHIFGRSHKCHSHWIFYYYNHNGPCLLRLQSNTYISYNYII